MRKAMSVRLSRACGRGVGGGGRVRGGESQRRGRGKDEGRPKEGVRRTGEQGGLRDPAPPACQGLTKRTRRRGTQEQLGKRVALAHQAGALHCFLLLVQCSAVHKQERPVPPPAHPLQRAAGQRGGGRGVHVPGAQPLQIELQAAQRAQRGRVLGQHLWEGRRRGQRVLVHTERGVRTHVGRGSERSKHRSCCSCQKAPWCDACFAALLPFACEGVKGRGEVRCPNQAQRHRTAGGHFLHQPPLHPPAGCSTPSAQSRWAAAQWRPARMGGHGRAVAAALTYGRGAASSNWPLLVCFFPTKPTTT